MVRFEVPDSSSSEEDRTYHPPTAESSDNDGESSPLSELSRSPTPPPEIHIPKAKTRSRVRFNPVTKDTNDNNELLKDLVRHGNIVDFYHMEADDLRAAKDGLEDVDYDPANDYVSHYTDIRTLQEIIDQHRRPPGIPTSKIPDGLTEGHVWYVMLSILRALTYIHTGQKGHSMAADPTEADPPPGWMPIAHNGIRPENIILQRPMSKHSKLGAFRYGACKLGNFECSVVLPNVGDIGAKDSKRLTQDEKTAIAERHDTFDKLSNKGEETGYEAPEIIADDGEKTIYPGPWSDLWSLGALAVEMMTCQHVWDLITEIEFKDKVQADPDDALLWERWRLVSMEDRHNILRKLAGKGRIAKGLSRLYSRDLRSLVEGLLSHNPWNRGTAPDVLQDVEERYETWKRKGHLIYERDAMQDMIDEQIDREFLHHIREAEEYLRRFEGRQKVLRQRDYM